MDEHDLRNCVFVSFLVNMQIMKNAGKIRAHTSKLELGVAA